MSVNSPNGRKLETERMHVHRLFLEHAGLQRDVTDYAQVILGNHEEMFCSICALLIKQISHVSLNY